MRYRSPEIRIHRILQFTFFILHLLLLACSCEKSTTAPPPPGPEIVLTLAEEPYLTEISLKLELRNLPLPQQLLITRNDSPIFNGSMAANDTTVTDSALQPATNYSYRAYRMVEGQKTDSSALLPVSTMDTTSHDFQWEIIEFPSLYGSGVLRDVAIINENDIWAVGEIYSDSAQPWLPYNAVHWDGQQWELKRITYSGSPWSIKSVFAFSSTDIWFDAFVRWNGNSFIQLPIPNILIGYGINKIWGTSSNNLYVVGTQGLIAHYDGRRWQKLESGTELGLRDIWGVSDNEIYIVGVNRAQVLGVVLKYDGSSWQKMIDGFAEGNGFDPSQLFKTQLYGATEGIWVDEHGTVYTVGNLMYQYKRGKWDYVRSLPENHLNGNPGNYYRGYLHAVRGNASNDMFIFGQSETLIHFNGSTWEKIGPAYVPWSPRWWYNSDVKRDLAVAVGNTVDFARIIKLWR